MCSVDGFVVFPMIPIYSVKVLPMDFYNLLWAKYSGKVRCSKATCLNGDTNIGFLFSLLILQEHYFCNLRYRYASKKSKLLLSSAKIISK